MNAYKPLESMKRREAAGFERRHAETIASEISDGTSELVTGEKLDKSLQALSDKFGIVMTVIVGIATSIPGVLISIK